MRRRLQTLVNMVPVLAEQYQARQQEVEVQAVAMGVQPQQARLLGLAVRALPGMMPIVESILRRTPDELLVSSISFINSILGGFGDPAITDEQFFSGVVVDAGTAQHADTAGQDGTQA